MQRVTTYIAAGLALLFADRIQAVDLYGLGRPLGVTLYREEAGFEIPYYDAFITVGENKFTFVVPQGFLLKGDPLKGRLILGNREGDCAISFAILSSESGNDGETTEARRALVLKQHPGGRILGDVSAGVCGQGGQGFDIQWKVAEDLYECQRVAFVPTKFGMFVFTATSGRNRFADSQANLSLIMATFRASTDGKFRPVHILDVN